MTPYHTEIVTHVKHLEISARLIPFLLSPLSPKSKDPSPKGISGTYSITCQDIQPYQQLPFSRRGQNSSAISLTNLRSPRPHTPPSYDPLPLWHTPYSNYSSSHSFFSYFFSPPPIHCALTPHQRCQSKPWQTRYEENRSRGI